TFKPRRGALGRLAINRRAARSRKRSTSGRVEMGSACPGVCAEPPSRTCSKLPKETVPLVCAEPHGKV
ncbi:hypothetical protein LKD81_02115, partial [Lachnospiraceae bacterium CLA-AA-H215]